MAAMRITSECISRTKRATIVFNIYLNFRDLDGTCFDILWRFDEAMSFQSHSESQYKGQSLFYSVVHKSLFYNNSTVCMCVCLFMAQHITLLLIYINTTNSAAAAQWRRCQIQNLQRHCKGIALFGYKQSSVMALWRPCHTAMSDHCHSIPNSNVIVLILA